MQKKSLDRRVSAPDPAVGAYDAPPGPLVGWGGANPSPFPTPRRLRHLDSRRLQRFISSIQISNRRYTYDICVMGPHKIFGPRAPQSLNPALGVVNFR